MPGLVDLSASGEAAALPAGPIARTAGVAPAPSGNPELIAFMRHARHLAAQRSRCADHALYERLKADLNREVPGLEPVEYERAIRILARVAGV